MSMSVGPITLTASGSTYVNMSCTAASGGTGPYTYQWYVSTTSGFTPGAGNIYTGATGLTLNAPDLATGTTYYFKVKATDSVAATAVSGQFAGTPLAVGSCSVQFLDYKAETTLTGNSQSMYKFLTPWTGDWSDMLAVKLSYLRAYDAHDMTLQCSGVSVDWLGDDPNCGKGVITVKCIPAWKLALLVPNSPFRIKGRAATEVFTINTRPGSSNPLKWADGSLVQNVDIKPTVRVPTLDLEIYGTRTAVNAWTYAQYSGCVNSDTFDGIPPGCAMMENASWSPRPLEDGVMTNDVGLPVKVRCLKVGSDYITWNHEWNETKGSWDQLAVPQFAAVAMSPLLA